MDTKKVLHFVPSEAPSTGSSKNGHVFQEMDLQDGQQEAGGQDSLATFRDHVYDDHISAEADVPEFGLLNTTRKYVKPMNFREVRAHRDLDGFLAQASILLDEKAAALDEVLRRTVARMVEDGHRSCSVDEVMNSLFTDAGGKELSVHLLSETIQGVTATTTGFQYQQAWLCILSTVRRLQRRFVSVARLEQPQNWGINCCEARYIILILAPPRTKSTKTAIELGRTFSTMFSDISFRQKLLETETVEEFRQELVHQRQQLSTARPVIEGVEDSDPSTDKPSKCEDFFKAGEGVYDDLRRRLPLYPSDFTDGITGTDRSLLKYSATALFLYIAILLPAIAFGSLDDENTRGGIDVQRTIVGQSMGGEIYAVFAGSPLVVPLTTAPLAIFTGVIRGICDDYGLDFAAFYACVGLWSSLFLILGGVFNVSLLMKLFKRSTEEVFALFISIAFVGDAVKGTIKIFQHFYHGPTPVTTNASLVQTTGNRAAGSLGRAGGQASLLLPESLVPCTRERPVLCLLLMSGTLWLRYTLYLIRRSPDLNDKLREVVSDGALPVSVLIFSSIGSYLFLDIKLANKPEWMQPFADNLKRVRARLLKGTAFHWDLTVTGFINVLMSCLGLPWMHAAFPHSSLHARQLARVEQHVGSGRLRTTIVSVRETRVAALAAGVLVGLSVPLQWIPTPVLHGLFPYMAAISLGGNQMADRVALLLKEQTSYPPTHYIRRVPQRKVHLFTGLQMIQLVIVCTFGMHPLPYMKTVFPRLLMLLVPVRCSLLPRGTDAKYLDIIDAQHM